MWSEKMETIDDIKRELKEPWEDKCANLEEE